MSSSRFVDVESKVLVFSLVNSAIVCGVESLIANSFRKRKGRAAGEAGARMAILYPPGACRLLRHLDRLGPRLFPLLVPISRHAVRGLDDSDQCTRYAQMSVPQDKVDLPVHSRDGALRTS